VNSAKQKQVSSLIAADFTGVFKRKSVALPGPWSILNLVIVAGGLASIGQQLSKLRDAKMFAKGACFYLALK
jgi:hypothetical protein